MLNVIVNHVLHTVVNSWKVLWFKWHQFAKIISIWKKNCRPPNHKWCITIQRIKQKSLEALNIFEHFWWLSIYSGHFSNYSLVADWKFPLHRVPSTFDVWTKLKFKLMVTDSNNTNLTLRKRLHRNTNSFSSRDLRPIRMKKYENCCKQLLIYASSKLLIRSP